MENKRIIFIFLLLLITYSLMANEKFVMDTKKEYLKSNFVSKISLNFGFKNNYNFKNASAYSFKSRYTRMQRISKGFLALGIVGAALCGSSLGVSVLTLFFYAITFGFFYDSPLGVVLTWGWWAVVGGIVALGLPLLLIGFFLFRYFYKSGGNKGRIIKSSKNLSNANKIQLILYLKITMFIV